jgi:hypothetical protein
MMSPDLHDRSLVVQVPEGLGIWDFLQMLQLLQLLYITASKAAVQKYAGKLHRKLYSLPVYMPCSWA